MSDDKISVNPGIDGALHLDGDPDTIKAYYEDWAETYNDDTAATDYNGPRVAARLLKSALEDGGARLLDAGCGTGLVGAELAKLGFDTIDGFDLSESMAELARATGSYRQVLGEIDIMRAEEHYDGSSYDAVLSIGVFTLGHVPPEALRVLLQLTKPDGLLVISTRTQYYDQSGFRELLDGMLEAGEVELSVRLDNAPYNEDGAAHYFLLRRPA